MGIHSPSLATQAAREMVAARSPTTHAYAGGLSVQHFAQAADPEVSEAAMASGVFTRAPVRLVACGRLTK
jgi:hypothetical protein